MSRSLVFRSATFLRDGAIVAGLLGLGCDGSSSSGPAAAAPPAYPAGWERMQYSDAFRVPSGQMTSDRVLADWYQKGLAKLPLAGGSDGWSCEAWSRTENNMQFSVIWARRHGGSGGLPPTVAEDTFAMISRRSPDMKAIDSPGSAGGGYGQGKVYQGENARVFVRVGSLGSVLYIVSVRGDASLDAGNPYLRAFFDGFEPIAR